MSHIPAFAVTALLLAASCQTPSVARVEPTVGALRLVSDIPGSREWALSDSPPAGELMVIRCDYELAAARLPYKRTTEVFVSTGGDAHAESVVCTKLPADAAVTDAQWTVVGCGSSTTVLGELVESVASHDKLRLAFERSDGTRSVITYVLSRESRESATARLPALSQSTVQSPWTYVHAIEPSAGG